jgi:protein-disulfide isomerase
MCPFCQAFERENGRTLQHLVDLGRTRWIVHPVAFLDQMSNGTEYSSRTAAWAYAVGQLAPSAFGQFQNALFARQPREGSDGLTDEEIAGLAIGAGFAPGDVERLAEPRYAAVAEQSTRSAIEFGVEGTPTVLVSRPGVEKIYQWDGNASIAQLVDELAAAKL